MACAGKRRFSSLEQHDLGAPVEIRDEIDPPLALGRVHAPVALAQDRAGGARQLGGRGFERSGLIGLAGLRTLVHQDPARATLCRQICR